MTRLVKQLLAALWFRSGLLGLWWRRRRRPLVVMYHRVLEPERGNDVSQPGIVVSTTAFERQLAFLKRYFEIVPLAEVVPVPDPAAADDRAAPLVAPPQRITSSREQPRSRPLCAVTFDDGWADNLEQALPILDRLAVPATIFVAAGYVGTGDLFWPERVIHALRGAGRARVRAELLDGVPQETVAAVMETVGADDSSIDDALDRLIEHLKEVGEDERETLVETLAVATGRPATALEPRMLDRKGIETLRAAGIEIGSHGVSHAILTRIDHARAVSEIRESRRRLAGPAGEMPESFAYPNGDWSPAIAEAVREAGYVRAVATEPAANGVPDAGAHPFAVPRKNLSEGSSRGVRGFSESIFACEVLGGFDALRRMGGRR